MSSTTHRRRPPAPVRLIAGTPPGGGQDRAARALAVSLAAAGGPEIAVSNLPGRGGGVAWARLADDPGNTTLVSISSPTLLTNAINHPDEPGIDRLTHLGLLCSEAIVFVSATLSTPDDLLASLGVGTTTAAIATARGNVNHVAVATLARHAGVDPRTPAVHAYGSAPAAVAAVVEGRATLAAVSAASALAEIRSGSVRALAVSGPGRLPGSLAGVPTWSELGVPCEWGTWRGVVAPPGLPVTVAEAWDEYLAAAVLEPTWRAALADHLWSDAHLPSAAAGRFVHDQDLRLREALGELEMVDG